jgi:hypothetical protein
MPASTPAQQARQGGLAVEEWAIAQILAIVLDQIKGIEARHMCSRSAAELVEPGQAVGPQHHRFAVDGEAPSLDPLCRGGDRGQSCGPIKAVAAVEPHDRAIQAHDHAVPIVLDFVNPISTRRRF